MKTPPKEVTSLLTTAEQIAHLFRRAGFGARPAEVEAWAKRGLDAAVSSLLTAPSELETIQPAPGLPAENPLSVIQANWVERMARTRYPLVEKMVLFWHGHLTSGIEKVREPNLMQAQNDLFRAHALGSFPELLRKVGMDPAMMLWLDTSGSRKGAPNENYPREVMELFTTGPGGYTERDVQESARAFTGWRYDRLLGQLNFNPKLHDSGSKAFLGKTGNFGPDEIAAILAARPETPRFLAGRLWRFFGSLTPNSSVTDAMAKAYDSTGGSIMAMLRALFTHQAFYDPAIVGALIKDPTEFVVGTLRALDLHAGKWTGPTLTAMGQTLFNPPNVAGWPGGPAWLGATALLTRWNWGEWVKSELGATPRPALIVGNTPERLLDGLSAHLSIPTFAPASREALIALAKQRYSSEWERARSIIRALVAAPEYQTN